MYSWTLTFSLLGINYVNISVRTDYVTTYKCCILGLLLEWILTIKWAEIQICLLFN